MISIKKRLLLKSMLVILTSFYDRKVFSAEERNVGAAFLGAFFNSNNKPDIFLVKSDDGVSFTKLPTGSNFSGRDPNIIIYNDCFIISHTGVDRDSFPDNKELGDFTILSSKDMVNWIQYRVTANGNNNLRGEPGSILGGNIPRIDSVWAPSLFNYNNELYVVISVGINHDKDGKELFSPVIMRCNNSNKFKFSNPRPILNDFSGSVIDTRIIYQGKRFIAVSKSEINGDIIFSSSKSIDEYFTVFNVLPFRKKYGFMVEAPDLVWNEIYQLWFLYLDKPTNEMDYYYCTSKDLMVWSLPKKLNNAFKMRHGNVIYIGEKDKK